MIETHLQAALKKIPLQWPLIQSVALNPLEDLTQLSIQDATRQITRNTGILFNEAFEQFQKRLKEGTIEKAHLCQAIENSELLKHTKNAELESSKNLLLKFLLDAELQNKIIQTQTAFKAHKIKFSQSLISQQIAEKFHDNPHEAILTAMLDALMHYYHKGATLLLSESMSFFEFGKDYLNPDVKMWMSLFTDANNKLDAFIEEKIRYLGIEEEYMTEYFFAILWQLRGWIGIMKWQSKYDNPPWLKQKVTPKAIIALWLTYEQYYLEKFSNIIGDFKYQPVEAVQMNEVEIYWQQFVNKTDILSLTKIQLNYEKVIWLWQYAYELGSQQYLQKQITSKTKSPETKALEAQWVFCIDVRSEALRRHLESKSSHQTYGFAGFFGFGFNLQDPQKTISTSQCPALLQPEVLLEIQNLQLNLLQNAMSLFNQYLHNIKKERASAFMLFELVGIWFSLALFARNYLPHRINFQNAQVNTGNFSSEKVIESIGFDAAVANASFVLKSIGLTENFAPFVVLCGHSATITNNPFAAILDCGACGGNSGVYNAMVAAIVLNDEKVRSALKDFSIHIPADTMFVPACHDTTTQTITWHYHRKSLNTNQKQLLKSIQVHGQSVHTALTLERKLTAQDGRDVQQRALNWAELNPEWGLINNCAMVIGPRSLTQHFDMKQKAFLHSYDPSLDSDGAILAGIMNAPMVVALWINLQYYFSAVNPEAYGSGNKAIHNVIPTLGVMEGNQSDLKFGLPMQSLTYQDENLHACKRLSVFIYANKKTVETIIEENPYLKNLVQGNWCHLNVIEPTD